MGDTVLQMLRSPASLSLGTFTSRRQASPLPRKHAPSPSLSRTPGPPHPHQIPRGPGETACLLPSPGEAWIVVPKQQGGVPGAN